MPQQSLNFRGHISYPQVDIWGADAERLLLDRPDLSLVRCRQLVELLVRVVAGRALTGDLCTRIDTLEAQGKLPSKLASQLHKVRRDSNEALHVAELSVPGPGAWEKPARRALRICAAAWAWLGNVPAAELVLPEGMDRASRALAGVSAKLDRAEELVEQERNFDDAEALLASIVEGPLRKAGVDELQRMLIALRIDSIRLAASNHRGESPPPLDPDRSRALVASGDPEALDEVVHYHNRHAIALLNALRITEALEAVTELEVWRSAQEELLPGPFASLAIRDWQRGALLGTRGQALAFLAHAEQEPAHLDEAIGCFELARRCFTEASDQQRQETYRLHALAEKLRLGATLSDDERAELSACIKAAPRLGEGWSPEAFQVAVALKAALLLGQRPSWLRRACSELGWLDDSRALRDPYEQIAGGLLLLSPSPPRRLRKALERTERAGGLVGWIAGCYLAAATGAAPPRPPAVLTGWWERYAIADWAGAGALAVLPFNYC